MYIKYFFIYLFSKDKVLCFIKIGKSKNSKIMQLMHLKAKSGKTTKFMLLISCRNTKKVVDIKIRISKGKIEHDY